MGNWELFSFKDFSSFPQFSTLSTTGCLVFSFSLPIFSSPLVLFSSGGLPVLRLRLAAIIVLKENPAYSAKQPTLHRNAQVKMNEHQVFLMSYFRVLVALRAMHSPFLSALTLFQASPISILAHPPLDSHM